MRTTASSWRTVMGTTGVSLSFSLAAARPCDACIDDCWHVIMMAALLHHCPVFCVARQDKIAIASSKAKMSFSNRLQ